MNLVEILLVRTTPSYGAKKWNIQLCADGKIRMGSYYYYGPISQNVILENDALRYPSGSLYR